MSKFHECLSSGVGEVALTRIWGWTDPHTDGRTGATDNAHRHSLNGGGIKFLKSIGVMAST